jgi:hypothetical protein
MANFDLMLKYIQEPAPTPIALHFNMGLDTLAFLDPTTYGTDLVAWLGSGQLKYVAAASTFELSSLLLDDGVSVICGIQGTRNFTQWVNYVTGAQMRPWLPGRGRVFAPFAQSALDSYARFSAQIPAGRTVYMSGHSLGAAVAAMDVTLLEAAGIKCPVQYFFAFPPVGDSSFVSGWRGRPILCNHPLDPVPLLPPDVVSVIGVSPFEADWQYGVFPVGQPIWPYAVGSLPPRSSPVIVAAAMASQLLSVNTCPHNTYRYLQATLSGLGSRDRRTMEGFTSILERLQLFKPWPS